MEVNMKSTCNMGKIEFSKDGALVIPMEVVLATKIHQEKDVTQEQAIMFGEGIKGAFEEFLDDFVFEVEFQSKRGDFHEEG
jgi:hypothetical protein